MLELTRQKNLKQELQAKHEVLIQKVYNGYDGQATEFESEINMLRSELNRLTVKYKDNASKSQRTYEIRKVGEVITNGGGLVSEFNQEESKFIKNQTNIIKSSYHSNMSS